MISAQSVLATVGLATAVTLIAEPVVYFVPARMKSKNDMRKSVSVMSNLELFSWVLVGYGLIGFWITGKHNYGWLMAVTFQIGWTWYALHIHSYALAAQSVAFMVIAIRNYKVGRNK
jgi:hypothetical protein